ncbi:hypothetical protein ACLOJK_019861 [Asimina triloba]
MGNNISSQIAAVISSSNMGITFNQRSSINAHGITIEQPRPTTIKIQPFKTEAIGDPSDGSELITESKKPLTQTHLIVEEPSSKATTTHVYPRQ